MKKILMFLTIGATVAMLALPVAAQTQKNAAPANTVNAAPANPAQDACAQEARDALYKTFTENRKTDQKKAFEAGKKYLACPVETPTESQTKIIEYLTRWVKDYEKGDLWNRFTDELYNKKNYPEAFKLGGQVLKADPESELKVIVNLGANGYLVAPLNNAQLTAEAVDYARRALQQLDAGKTLDDWAPLTKDIAHAYVNYTIGSLTVDKEPEKALKNLIKSAQFETPLKKSAFTYALIAGAYETGAYARLSEDYKKYSGKDETPESKLALANIHQVVDRMIDGYARAVALAGSDAKIAPQKTQWNDSLKQWYKFRNPTEPETGVDALVAGILSKPLPPEPTPLTVLPATPAATTTGTSGSATPTNGTGNSTGNGATAPVKPGATPAATPAAPNTKPATNTPRKPRR